MAEVVVTQNVVLKVTDVEWRLIMKGLATLAGVKNLSVRPDEVEKAAELNKQLLTQRVGAVQAQLKTADDALDNAIESEGKTDWVREKEVR